MQKNFKDEYKDYMQKDIPDLWDRIEKELPQKEEKKPSKIYSIRRYAILAAACICIMLIASPIFLLQKKSAAPIAYEMAAEPMMEEAAAADVADPTQQMENAAMGRSAEFAETFFCIKANIIDRTENGEYLIDILDLLGNLETGLEVGMKIEAFAEETMEPLEIGKEYELEIISDQEKNNITIVGYN